MMSSKTSIPTSKRTQRKRKRNLHRGATLIGSTTANFIGKIIGQCDDINSLFDGRCVRRCGRRVTGDSFFCSKSCAIAATQEKLDGSCCSRPFATTQEEILASMIAYVRSSCRKCMRPIVRDPGEEDDDEVGLFCSRKCAIAFTEEKLCNVNAMGHNKLQYFNGPELGVFNETRKWSPPEPGNERVKEDSLWYHGWGKELDLLPSGTMDVKELNEDIPLKGDDNRRFRYSASSYPLYTPPDTPSSEPPLIISHLTGGCPPESPSQFSGRRQEAIETLFDRAFEAARPRVASGADFLDVDKFSQEDSGPCSDPKFYQLSSAFCDQYVEETQGVLVFSPEDYLYDRPSAPPTYATDISSSSQLPMHLTQDHGTFGHVRSDSIGSMASVWSQRSAAPEQNLDFFKSYTPFPEYLRDERVTPGTALKTEFDDTNNIVFSTLQRWRLESAEESEGVRPQSKWLSARTSYVSTWSEDRRA